MWKRLLRGALSDNNDRYVFKRFNGSTDSIRLRPNMGLYVHVPFCKNLCPYCPYYKELYQENRTGRYLEAVLKEISLYSTAASKTSWSSLYIGGGTPTLLMRRLSSIKEALRVTLPR